jgi:ribosomal protein S18 acetylase RimI-like enzyme
VRAGTRRARARSKRRKPTDRLARSRAAWPTEPPAWKIRHVREDEFEPWSRLFRGYCDFYEQPTSDEHQRQVWGWIHDDRSVEALVAVEVDDVGGEIDRPRGLAHLRTWVRPLRGNVSGYLDDLFVDPEARGSGVVDALFSEMNRMGLERGWPAIRWTTADDNYRARGAYDKVAVRTMWITYEMTPTP